MSTTADLNDLLRTHEPLDIIKPEFSKYNAYWNMVKKDKTWTPGQVYKLKYESGGQMNGSMGSLVDEADLINHQHVSGSVASPAEYWTALVFNESDLEKHSGNMKASYLGALKEQIPGVVKRATERVNIMLLGDGSIAKATANGTAGGAITVDRPYLFQVGERINVKDADTAAAEGVITAINLNTGVLTVKDAIGGSAVDLSTFTTAQAAKIYVPNGSGSEKFVSLRDMVFSAANGGSDSIHGLTKTNAPVLQCIEQSGSAWTASTILDDLYNFVFAVEDKGIQTQDMKVIVPTNVMKACIKKLETSKRFAKGETTAGYGFSEVEILGPYGTMRLRMLKDLAQDNLFLYNGEGACFAGKEFFSRKQYHGGSEFYTIRATTGLKHIVDIKFEGQHIFKKNCMAGVHSIPAL